MKGHAQDREGVALQNENFRKVLYTAQRCQWVVMALKTRENRHARIGGAAASLLDARQHDAAHAAAKAMTAWRSETHRAR